MFHLSNAENCVPGDCKEIKVFLALSLPDSQGQTKCLFQFVILFPVVSSLLMKLTLVINRYYYFFKLKTTISMEKLISCHFFFTLDNLYTTRI